MENEEYIGDENEETTLRKYSASPVAAIVFIAFAYLIWTYSYTSLNLLGCAVIIALTIFSGLHPIRTQSHFVINEFYIDDFALVLGLFWLDPFQLGVAFTIGGLIFHIIEKFSIKRLFTNLYSNFIVVAIPGVILQSPTGIHSRYFPLIMLCGLILIYIIDTVLFYAVCKYNLKENLNNIISPLELSALVFGLVLGIPTCIIIDTKPAYAIVMFLLFAASVIAANRHNKVVTRMEQLEQIVDFMRDTADIETMKQSENRFIEMTKIAFKHDKVSIRTTKPNEQSEVGQILYSDEKGDHWLIVNKPDVSKNRVSHDELLILDVVNAARQAFEHRALQEKLFKAARHDSLTGLSNRGTLEEYIHHELGLVKRNQTQFCIMFIDIDDFKPVNDIHGHKAGDELLKCIARRLSLTVRAQDVVARIGGDEFVILCRDISIEEAKNLANRIAEEIAKPVFVDRELDESNPFDNKSSEPRIEVKVNSSIGISQSPADGITFENLIRAADERMYEAKKLKSSSRTVEENNTDESHIAEVG